jgi:dihydroflavonol-4-reductase
LPREVLVTGATGFIGSALCRLLIERGHAVRALHRPNSSLTAIEKLPLERVLGDILQPDTLPPAMQGVEWVFHAAAESAHWRHPERVTRVTVEGTRNTVRAARDAGVRRLIYTSSIASLGVPPEGHLLTEQHNYNLDPGRFPYGYAKLHAEQAALQTAERSLEIVIVNPSIVLGAGDRNQISGTLVIESARGHIPFYPVGGTNFVHIDDVAIGHLAAAEHGRPGERYILAGENITYRQALVSLADITGSTPPKLRLPARLTAPASRIVVLYARLIGVPLDPNLIRLSRYHLFCDRSKARRELGLADVLPFRRAAREAYDWYREQGILE